jgi:hypothetical protein
LEEVYGNLVIVVILVMEGGQGSDTQGNRYQI